MNIDLPSVKSESTFESLCKSVGFVIIQWGQSEQSLELMVNVLFRDCGGNKLPKRKKLPKQLAEKLSFVKECASAIPSLAVFRDDLESLVSNFESLKQSRHALVHGALVDTKDVNGLYTFMRLEMHPEIHEVKKSLYDLKEFPALADALSRLGADVSRLATLVADACSTNHDGNDLRIGC